MTNATAAESKKIDPSTWVTIGLLFMASAFTAALFVAAVLLDSEDDSVEEIVRIVLLLIGE